MCRAVLCCNKLCRAEPLNANQCEPLVQCKILVLLYGANLCCAVLCCAVLCYAELPCAELCCAVTLSAYCAVVCQVAACHAVPFCTVLAARLADNLVL